MNYPTYYRAKAIKRRKNIQSVKAALGMIFATFGIFVVTSGVLLTLLFISESNL